MNGFALNSEDLHLPLFPVELLVMTAREDSVFAVDKRFTTSLCSFMVAKDVFEFSHRSLYLKCLAFILSLCTTQGLHCTKRI